MTETYPDWTEQIQTVAAKGGKIKLRDDVLIHQVAPINQSVSFQYDGNGYVLHLPDNPSVNFLNGAGKPIGPPHGPKDGSQYDVFRSYGAKIRMKHYYLDFNIQTPSDAPGTSAFMPSKLDSRCELKDTVLINQCGGAPHNHPDGIHLEAYGQVIDGLQNTENALPVDYSVEEGSPPALICASTSTAVQQPKIWGVDDIGPFEIDGILFGGSVESLNAHQCLISAPGGSWGGHKWWNVTIGPRTDPPGPVVDFHTTGTYIAWVIEKTRFEGTIANPGAFKGTWGANNSPTTL